MSFSIGAYRGRVVLAVVAAMVGLAVAALPAAPAAAATSQTLVPWGRSPAAGGGADGAV